MWNRSVRGSHTGYVNYFLSLQKLSKAHTAPFTPTVRVVRENFRWLSGADKLSSFESSAGRLRLFCSVCGSHLAADRPHQRYVILRVATLDDDPGVKPEAHIWTGYDVEWLEYEGIPSYEEWQEAR